VITTQRVNSLCQRLGAMGVAIWTLGDRLRGCDALARRQRVRTDQRVYCDWRQGSVCVAASRSPRVGLPRDLFRWLREPATDYYPASNGKPVVRRDGFLWRQFGLFDNEYLDGARTPCGVGGVPGADVASVVVG